MPLDRRKLRYGSSSAIAVLAFAGVVIFANIIAQRHYRRWDWTGSGIYSLSDKTVKLLTGLKTDVDVAVLIQPGAGMYDEVRELLGNYGAKSPHLKVEFLDPATQPARVQQILKKFGIDPRGDTTAVVFSSGDRHKHVAVNELADYDMAMAGYGEAPRVKAFKGEAAFTSALLSVTETKQSKICALKGHDEVSVEEEGAQDPKGMGRFRQELQRENFKIETTDVLGKSPLPPDCDVLVIAGPTRGFTPPEAEALASWVDAGGRLLALIDPPFARDGSLQKLGIEQVFRDRGIVIGDDIVLDPSQRLLFGTAESFAASDFPAHEITKDLKDTAVIFGLARSVGPAEPPPAGWTVLPLARTTGEGWGERDLAHLGAVSKGPEDLKGPVPVAVAAEKAQGGGKAARMVVVGDSDFGHNNLLGVYANLDFLLNSVHWLVGRGEQIGITSREPEHVQLAMTGPQEKGVIFFTLFALPGLAVVSGVVVWFLRRR